MRIRIPLFAALLAAATAVSAQTLDEIVAKNIEARGGGARLRGIRSVRMAGTMTLGPGREAAVAFEFKRPRKLRQEVTVLGSTAVTVYDGAAGWQVVPFARKNDPEPLSADELKEMEEQSDIEGDLVDWKEKGSRVELIGREIVDGRDAWKLRITLRTGTTRTAFLDAGTSLEIRGESVRKIQGADVEIVSVLGDYRDVSGVKIPFAIESRVKGATGPGQKVTFTSVELNVPVDDARFARPPAKPVAAPTPGKGGASGP